MLFYGIGSKKRVIHSLAQRWFTDGPTIVVNGYFPGLMLKQVR